jgi:hypothetical protein
VDTPLAVAGTPVAVVGTPVAGVGTPLPGAGVEEGTLVAVREEDNQGRLGFEEEEGRPPVQKMTLPYSQHVTHYSTRGNHYNDVIFSQYSPQHAVSDQTQSLFDLCSHSGHALLTHASTQHNHRRLKSRIFITIACTKPDSKQGVDKSN